ncbi:uncharacterized protein WCC33_013273 [Rhinophrynus dorsalis]
MASADLREELNCSICLSVYTDPVMLRCGHNFCRVCIRNVLDTQEGSGVYSCPDCRAEFQKRPALKRNVKLCNIVECYLSTHPDQEETGIFCSYCVHSPVPAVKSCLHCETSLCDGHIRQHNKLAEHLLVEPTFSFDKRKCAIHRKLLEYYCCEDESSICVSCCLSGEHRGHQVDHLNEASKKKKVELRQFLEKLTSKREEIENRLHNLGEHKREVRGKAEKINDLIRDIRKRLEALEKQVKNGMSKWEEQVSLQVSDLIQQLEIKKDEMSRKIHHIEELCNTTDPLTTLQRWEMDRIEFYDTETGQNGDRVDKKVPLVGEIDECLISVILHTALADIMADVKENIGSWVPVSPDISLDINTAADDVAISDDLKAASWTEINQLRPKTTKRFECGQVLSIRGFSSGRHYWEVETSESGDWSVGVAYPSIEREGDQSWIGNNKKSWTLDMYGDVPTFKDYSVIHDSDNTPLPPDTTCRRLGIFLDYEAGRLSFYQLCDPVRHLHTFTATFTEPLHAAFCVRDSAWEGKIQSVLQGVELSGTNSSAGQREALQLSDCNSLAVGDDGSCSPAGAERPHVDQPCTRGMATADLREELNCSICLSIYTDPVMLRCGHNFCQVCIRSVLDTQEVSGVYSCPECRKRFNMRPVPQRNMKLCNIVERFLCTQPDQEVTRISCTYCDSLVPAVKTCLQCETSLCDNHLLKHNMSVEHDLILPVPSLKGRKCFVHKKMLEYHCSEDDACICVSCCLAGEHRGHRIQVLNEASEKKKEKLRNILEKLTTVRERTEKRVQSLHEHRGRVQEKAAGVTERVSALFRDIKEQMDALEKRVLSEISRQVEQVSHQVYDLIQQLEMERDELSRKMRHIEKLCNMTDPLTVLLEWESDNFDYNETEEGNNKEGNNEESDNEEREDEESNLESDEELGDEVVDDKDDDEDSPPSVNDLDEGLIPCILHTTLDDIVTDIKREFYGQEASDLLLDVDTAHLKVVVSGDLKTASWSERSQRYPAMHTRFIDYPQVLGIGSFSTGKHYWEVETSDSGEWEVGMTYPSIKREGSMSRIGNNKSWSLCRFDKKYLLAHDCKLRELSLESPCYRLGMFLDYEAGRLSFYQLCDPIRHLHTFTATFTEPLHVGLGVSNYTWIKILT